LHFRENGKMHFRFNPTHAVRLQAALPQAAQPHAVLSHAVLSWAAPPHVALHLCCSALLLLCLMLFFHMLLLLLLPLPLAVLSPAYPKMTLPATIKSRELLLKKKLQQWTPVPCSSCAAWVGGATFGAACQKQLQVEQHAVEEHSTDQHEADQHKAEQHGMEQHEKE
jgi:hypothetical protein